MAANAVELDAQLMLRVREGDVQSFSLLLERHRAPVINFLSRMVQNQAIAEELAQEAFLRVYRSRSSYVPRAKFTTWLFRIASHVALNYIRDGRHEKKPDNINGEPTGFLRDLPDRNPTVEQSLLADVRVQEIRDAIDLLPAKQRAAVLMHKYQEMDYIQIADVLMCSESAVKSLLFRAYERLRSRLAYMVA
jgi:RNA polymerase sigma-70 factor, ECF subfamily